MLAEKPQVARVTLKDADQTISFRASLETVQRLVAGCAGNPAKVGELLVATDIYERGLAAQVMSELMEFDKTLQRDGVVVIHNTIRLARDNGGPVERAFQVIDKLTESEALEQRVEPVIIIDLTQRRLHASAALDLRASGEVRIQEGRILTDRTVTFILPPDWKIQSW